MFEVSEHDGIVVVRDDCYPGGTKARVLPRILVPGTEYVYASPAYGYAQVALAHACATLGGQATVFTAARRELHSRTREAQRVGARVVQVPTGYMSNVRAKARAYADFTGAILLPFGFDSEDFVGALADLARTSELEADEVWTVAGSGTLSRALQQAWPRARFHAVRIGAAADVGGARLWTAPEKFEVDAKIPPPFPSCSNYDAKAWRFIREHAAPGALFWNVAG